MRAGVRRVGEDGGAHPVPPARRVRADACFRPRPETADHRRRRSRRRGLAHDRVPRPQRTRQGRPPDPGARQAGGDGAGLPPQSPGATPAPRTGEGDRARVVHAVRRGGRAVAARVLHGGRRGRRGECPVARLRPGARAARAVGFGAVLRGHRRGHRGRAGRRGRGCGATARARAAVRVARQADGAGRGRPLRRPARWAGRGAAAAPPARTGSGPAGAARRIRLAALVRRRARRL